MERIIMNRLIKLFILLIAVCLAFVTSLYLYEEHRSAHFICGHSQYKIVNNGMTKEKIRNILGKPDKKIIKAQNAYSFAQGELEDQIREGWIYNFFGWSGGIEIYFDVNGIVIGKNCGYC